MTATVNDLERADAWMSANMDCVVDARDYKPAERKWTCHWKRKRDNLAAQFATVRAPLSAASRSSLLSVTSWRPSKRPGTRSSIAICAHWVGRIAESVDPLKHRVRLEARIAELEATSESAAAYGLPTCTSGAKPPKRAP